MSLPTSPEVPGDDEFPDQLRSWKKPAWPKWTIASARFFKHLDDIGEAENTIVIFTTDNGAEVFTWPDGGMTPFRATKGTIVRGRLSGTPQSFVGPDTSSRVPLKMVSFQVSTGSPRSWRQPAIPTSPVSF